MSETSVGRRGSLDSIPLHGPETAHGTRKTAGELAQHLHSLTIQMKLKDFEDERRGRFISETHRWAFFWGKSGIFFS